jgi:two-component system sensor histidine kinase KdpD
VKYNKDHGLLRVRTGRSGRWSGLVVTNDGVVLAPGAAAMIFELFYRGEHTRGGGSEDAGTGLGLSIVHAVVEAHGGEATALPRADGGLRISLRFPAPE